MATKEQQAPADGDDDDGWFSWLNPKNWLKSLSNIGIGGMFNMLFDVVIWGAIFLGVYWLAKQFEPQITEGLNDLTPEWRLGDKFKGLMDRAGTMLSGLMGNNDSVFGKVDAPKPEAELKKFFVDNKVSEALADVLAKNAPAIRKVLDDNKLFIGTAFDKGNLPKTLPAMMNGLDNSVMQQFVVAALQSGDGQGGLSQQSKDMVSVILNSNEPGMDEVRQKIPALVQSIEGQVTDKSTKRILDLFDSPVALAAEVKFAHADGVGEAKMDELLTACTTKGADGKPDFNSPQMKSVVDSMQKDPKYRAALADLAKSVAPTLSDQDGKAMMNGLAAVLAQPAAAVPAR